VIDLDPALLYLFPAVFVAGFIDAIAGGGGLITVPAYLLAGVPPIFTLGTNKFVSTTGTIVSSARYIFHKKIIWPVAIVGIPCALVGASLGAHSVAQLDQDLVRRVILICLPIAAALTLIPRRRTCTPEPLHWQSRRLWIVIPLIGLAIGWYDGFFGPGTGSLLIIALHGFAHLSLLHAAAVGRLFNLASNAAALVTFIIHGKVLYAIGLPLVVAGMGGHYLGSHMAIRKGDAIVRPVLIVAITLLFGYLIWQQMR
jgi:uncharacterized protein